jgi:hypothetical protein
MSSPQSPRLYVLIRADLSPEQQAVQAGHAVAEFILRGPATHWNNDYLIYLHVKNEDELFYWGDRLERKGHVWIGFKEPDMDNELTAIAVECNGRTLRKLEPLRTCGR